MSRHSFLLLLAVTAAVTACADRGPQGALAEGQKLAADRIDQVLTLQPGVIASSANGPVDIRGGRRDAAVSYVDGVPVTARALADHSGPGRPGSPSDTTSLPSMLIRTGNAALRVDSLEPAISALTDLTRRAGGYVGNTFFTGGEENRRQATLQLRVPANRFGDLQAGLAAIGEVKSLAIQVQDVGEEYTDAAARVKSKRQAEARMLDLLRTRAGKLSDVVELEQALEQVREEIEATEGRLRYLRNQVGLSTMTVTLSEPGLEIAQPGYHPIRDAFGAAWRNFTTFIAGLISASGWLIPLVAVAVLGGKGLLWLWRRRKTE